MPDSRQRRLMKEIADIQNDKGCGITIDFVEEDKFTHLKGSFRGPENSPYENGLFKVDIVVPENYPFQPLKMKMETKIYHPNISSQTGAICLDILKDAWSPVLTLKTALVSLQSLLCSPEPNDPQDAQVAKVYINNRSQFNSMATQWTKQFAPLEGAPAPVDKVILYGLSRSEVEKYTSMGFNEDQVIEVLRALHISNKEVSEHQVIDKLVEAS